MKEFSAAALLLLLAATAQGASLEATRLDLSQYYRYEQLEPLLREHERTHPDLAKLRSIGKSVEGRDLWVMEICNPKTGAATDKAAMYIDANLHGNEIQGTETCLYTIHTLLSRHGSDPLITRVVDQRVFLIAPCMNPDGRSHFLAEPGTPHSNRNNRRPVDDDHDGLIDEDGPDDLDSDLEILQMRRRRLAGPMTVGLDERVLSREPLGDGGECELLGTEGRDNDGDGLSGEDPPGGVDLNRNFPTAWKPGGLEPGAGPYPLSEPETRAIVAYLISWPNLAAAQSYHNDGSLILRPPSSSPDVDAAVPAADLAVFDALGHRGEQLLPGYRYLQTFEGLYPAHGGFLDWIYLGRGIIAFSNELWSLPQDYDEDGEITEGERLRWNDEALQGTGFAPWHEVEHPDLGAIELGGWRKLARRVPPTFLLEELCEQNMRFTLEHADAMPRLEISSVTIRSFSTRLHQVDVTVVNAGLIPTATVMAKRAGVAYDDVLALEGRHTTVLGSGLLVAAASTARLERHQPEQVSLGNISGHGAVTVRFIVEGWQAAILTLQSEKGGTIRHDFSYK